MQTVRHRFNIYAGSCVALAYDAERGTANSLHASALHGKYNEKFVFLGCSFTAHVRNTYACKSRFLLIPICPLIPNMCGFQSKSKELRDFATIMSVCHTVVPERKQKSNQLFSSNRDESLNHDGIDSYYDIA